jgi:cytochrome P450
MEKKMKLGKLENWLKKHKKSRGNSICQIYSGFACKNLDLQGYPKKLKSIRDRFDEMMKKIIEEHREVRRTRKLLGDDVEAVRVRDFLDILMDISEDETSEFRLTRENIKAFIMVMLLFMQFYLLVALGFIKIPKTPEV